MARRRIFARKQTRRWPLAVALSFAATGLLVMGGLRLLPGTADIPACSADEVRRDLRDLLRERSVAGDADEVKVVALSENKRVFRSDRILARDCAATARVDGAEERFRFRITRDDDAGYVLSLPEA